MSRLENNPLQEFLLSYIRGNSGIEFQKNNEHILSERNGIFWDLPFSWEVFVYAHTIKSPDIFKIPPEIRERFKESYIRNLALNEFTRHEAVRIAREFLNNDVRVIFLKGTALLFTVYKNEHIRSMDDIDILVQKSDLERAENILSSMGYIKSNGGKPHPFHHIYIKDSQIIELHWDIIALKNPKFLDELSVSLSSIDMGETKIDIFGPEAIILHLCLNFNSTLYFICSHTEDISDEIFLPIVSFIYELKRILDFYADKINWDRIMVLTRMIEFEYPVFSLLLFAEKFGHAGIPANMSLSMKTNVITRALMFLCRNSNYNDCKKSFLIREMINNLTLSFSDKVTVERVMYRYYLSSLIFLFIYLRGLYNLYRKINVNILKH